MRTNSFIFFLYAIIALGLVLPVYGQGIIVHRKSGEKVVFPYSDIDSIVGYNFGEYVPNIYTINGVTFQMIYVEGGTFQMGAKSDDISAKDNEKPVHSVTLSDYYIGQTEVTQALWTTVMGSNPSSYKGGDNYPVENVSWYDCQEFIKKLNALTGKQFRLPTEAEWEYACRGGNKSHGYKYSGDNIIGFVGWFIDNSGHHTHVVSAKDPNELGIYDMSGNVCEWCQDGYGDYSSDSQTNPNEPGDGWNFVIRGGFYNSESKDCRSTYRSYNGADIRGCAGLRIVLPK